MYKILKLKKFIHYLIPSTIFWKFCNLLPFKKSNYLFTNSLNGYKNIYDNEIINSKFNTLLHIGCNTGSYGNHLNNILKNKTFYLNDINSSLFKYHKSLSNNFRFVKGDIVNINLPFSDIILCHTVLIYFDQKKLSKFLNKVILLNFKKLYIFEYFDDVYSFNYDNNIYIHSSIFLKNFFDKKRYNIDEININLDDKSDFQKKHIKLYLISKNI